MAGKSPVVVGEVVQLAGSGQTASGIGSIGIGEYGRDDGHSGGVIAGNVGAWCLRRQLVDWTRTVWPVFGPSPVSVVGVTVSDLTVKGVGQLVGLEDEVGAPSQRAQDVVVLAACDVGSLVVQSTPRQEDHGVSEWKAEFDVIAG